MLLAHASSDCGSHLRPDEAIGEQLPPPPEAALALCWTPLQAIEFCSLIYNVYATRI
jgi:hypothetical protein